MNNITVNISLKIDDWFKNYLDNCKEQGISKELLEKEIEFGIKNNYMRVRISN